MKPGVFITVDVECSMGGAWADAALRPVSPARAMMGDYGGRRLGLPLIVDLLERHGLKATFFVDPFAEELGHGDLTGGVCEYLLDHGQDIQLHVHPNGMHYGRHRQNLPFARSDDVADLDPSEQAELLAVGCERLERWTGRRPVAFRAGNMGADERVLEQLAAAGIRIDSSYTFSYLRGQCRFADPQEYNGSKWYGQVLELALSGFRQVRLPPLHPAKPLDVVAISFGECRDVIRMICRAGADAVAILHSFSLFKVRNVQYDGGRIDRVVTRRFRRICEWLVANADDYPTYVFSDVAAGLDDGTYPARCAPPCRLNAPVRALARKAVQVVNSFYWT